jgi:hypothetical protein
MKMSEIIIKMEANFSNYAEEHYPKNGGIKVMNPQNGFCGIYDEEKRIMYEMPSVQIATVCHKEREFGETCNLMKVQELMWAWHNDNTLESHKSKSRNIFEFGEKKKILELIQPMLIFNEKLTIAAKTLRKEDNESNCSMIDGLFLSKYNLYEILALSCFIMGAKSYMILDFPENNLEVLHLIFKEPKIYDPHTQ